MGAEYFYRHIAIVNKFQIKIQEILYRRVPRRYFYAFLKNIKAENRNKAVKFKFKLLNNRITFARFHIILLRAKFAF